MFLPESYQVTLFLMVLSMLCWGSWANTLKLCPQFRFQLFYWDYAIGLAAGAVAWGVTAGSLGHEGQPFLTAVAHTPMGPIVWAICGGVIFNIANLLLVAAIDVAGLAVAFPVGIGLALVVGAVSSYLVSPAANPLLLFGGVALVAVAIVVDAAAYRKREESAKAATTRARCRRYAPAPPHGDAPPPATNPHPRTILRFTSPSSTPRHQPRRRNRLVAGEPPPNRRRPGSHGTGPVRRHPPPLHCRVGPA